jgi:hypothetical protein
MSEIPFFGNENLTNETIENTIIFKSKIGLKIKSDIPQIAEDYKNGLTLSELAVKYDIQTRYGLSSSKIAEGSVRVAIVGVEKGPIRFEGLITDKSLLQRLNTKHKQKAAGKVGALSHRDRTGIFSQTSEQLTILGRTNGELTKKQGIGIHALTKNERISTGKMGVESRGFTPYNREEVDLIQELLKDPEYRLKDGRTDTNKIAATLNSKIHNGQEIRTKYTISSFLSKEKSKK